MENKSLRLIVTGATGMVGEGVLHECLQHPSVAAVLVLGRKSCGLTHPKLTELLPVNLYNLSDIADQLTGYDGCLFCLGTSSVGKQEPEFFHITYTLTLHVAATLSGKNPAMTFCYISGAGTDSTEKGRLMWARVKGKTENDLKKLPFAAVYNFRPGYLHPTPGMKNTLPYYKYLSWLFPLLRPIFPGLGTTLRELGLAMINACLKGYPQATIEVKDIRTLAHL